MPHRARADRSRQPRRSRTPLPTLRTGIRRPRGRQKTPAPIGPGPHRPATDRIPQHPSQADGSAVVHLVPHRADRFTGRFRTHRRHCAGSTRRTNSRSGTHTRSTGNRCPRLSPAQGNHQTAGRSSNVRSTSTTPRTTRTCATDSGNRGPNSTCDNRSSTTGRARSSSTATQARPRCSRRLRTTASRHRRRDAIRRQTNSARQRPNFNRPA